MLNHIDMPIAAGVIAFIYSVILTEPDMCFFHWYRFLSEKILKTNYVWRKWKTIDDIIFRREYRKIGWFPQDNDAHRNLGEIIIKLLIGCDRCIAGQLTLWWYLFTVRPYNFMQHLFFICIAIFVPIIMNKIYRECRK